MALGFKNCCDSNEYFYLTGIPGYVLKLLKVRYFVVSMLKYQH